MAEGQYPLPAAPFPAPPPFWKHFTSTNLDRLKAIQSSTSSDSTPAQSLPRLPLELTYLLPPPPPPEGTTTYPTFNTSHAISPLPPPPSPEILLFNPADSTLNLPALLSKLTRSLLLNFLELTTILSQNPGLWREKVEDIRRLFMNAHYAVNLYRPHQAREGVIKWLEEEIERGEEELRVCDEVKLKAEEFLSSVERSAKADVGNAVDGSSKEKDRDKKELEEARRLWQAIRQLDDA